jgi:hypothetical protein
LEQDGYEQAPDTVRRPSQSRDPEGVPIAAVATPKKISEDQEKFQGVGAIFFSEESGRLTFSFRAPPRRPAPQGGFQPTGSTVQR